MSQPLRAHLPLYHSSNLSPKPHLNPYLMRKRPVIQFKPRKKATVYSACSQANFFLQQQAQTQPKTIIHHIRNLKRREEVQVIDFKKIESGKIYIYIMVS